MNRYSQGLKVPLIQVDSFTGKSADGAGNITLNLTHTPISIDDVSVTVGENNVGSAIRFYLKVSLTGKALVIHVIALTYGKANTPISADNSGGAGADPHTHTLAYTVTACANYSVAIEAQNTITVVYAVL